MPIGKEWKEFTCQEIGNKGNLVALDDHLQFVGTTLRHSTTTLDRYLDLVGKLLQIQSKHIQVIHSGHLKNKGKMVIINYASDIQMYMYYLIYIYHLIFMTGYIYNLHIRYYLNKKKFGFFFLTVIPCKTPSSGRKCPFYFSVASICSDQSKWHKITPPNHFTQL